MSNYFELLDNAYKEVSESEAGQLVLKDLEMVCGLYDPNDELDGIKEGKRQIALYIRSMLSEKLKPNEL